MSEQLEWEQVEDYATFTQWFKQFFPNAQFKHIETGEFVIHTGTQLDMDGHLHEMDEE